MSKLIVALGNPGTSYEQTRHNIGWQVFEKITFKDKLVWKEKFKGLYAQLRYEGDQCIFLKPQTYMNLSGESVRLAMDFFKVNINEIIVVHDEIDLPFGSIQLKKGGGFAGNNGLKSIFQHTSDKDFHRLRMGIGRPTHGDVSGHVLGKFNEDEKARIDEFLELGFEALECYLKEGFKKAQNKYSKKNINF